MDLMRKKAVLESRAVFQFSDGLLVAPSYDGIVNSGKFKTSFSNSKMRVIAAYLVGSDNSIAAGDDCIESFVENAIQKYRELGIVIKNYTEVSNTFEFCSHRYLQDGIFAMNVDKMIMNLLHSDLSTPLKARMQLGQFYAELGSHPNWEEIAQSLETMGVFEQVGAQIIDGE